MCKAHHLMPCGLGLFVTKIGIHSFDAYLRTGRQDRRHFGISTFNIAIHTVADFPYRIADTILTAIAINSVVQSTHRSLLAFVTCTHHGRIRWIDKIEPTDNEGGQRAFCGARKSALACAARNVQYGSFGDNVPININQN